MSTLLTIGDHPLLKKAAIEFNKKFVDNSNIVTGHAICDDTNNTFRSLADGVLHIDQYIQPVISAEFINVTFDLTRRELDAN